MPENDIYNNKEKYEGFLRNLDLILVPSEKRTDKNANKSVYFCKHKDNIKHFRKLAEKLSRHSNYKIVVTDIFVPDELKNLPDVDYP